MIFIDFGLLSSLYCKISYLLTYLLKITEVIQIWEFDNLHMTQCAKIIVGFMAKCRQHFFILSTFFYVFLPFTLIFTSTFMTCMLRSGYDFAYGRNDNASCCLETNAPSNWRLASLTGVHQ